MNHNREELRRVDLFKSKHSAFGRQATDKEKIYVVNTTNSGGISRKYKELLQINIKKTITMIKKTSNIFERTILKRRYINGQGAQEKLLNSINHHENAN